MKILLALPPMAQFNMPYPSTGYLAGYLKTKGHEVHQKDMSLALAHKLFSKDGLIRVKNYILANKKSSMYSESVKFFIEAFVDYQYTIEPVINFLVGNDSAISLRIAGRTLLPEGPRFMVLDELPSIDALFGTMGVRDQAKYLASLYIDDLADVIRDGVDTDFQLAKYGEKLASSMISFNFLQERLGKFTLIDEMIEELIEEEMKNFTPDIVGITIPFPGNLLGALRIGKWIKRNKSEVKIVVGGGYVNTELRQMEDTRPFAYFDYMIFDDGELPLERLLSFLEKKSLPKDLIRTWYIEDKKTKKINMESKENILFSNHPGPNYEGLTLNYISLCEMPNQMHRMWSDFCWNKMVLAHGCYWKKCTFCDTSLDYIERFEPAKAKHLVDQMENVIKQTRQSGFHFVDEAIPSSLLKSLSEEILKRGLKVTWWGNLRFDSQFTLKLCELMADAGCVAVTGGLEVAAPRILKLINKGVSVEQVREITANFSKAGIFVHAYLMYGYPTQTKQETIASLEVVRDLFVSNSIQSAFWHRFSCTVHSPVGKNPSEYKIILQSQKIPYEGTFAINDVPFIDETNIDHDKLGKGLNRALYNYMHGEGFDIPVKEWFKL